MPNQVEDLFTKIGNPAALIDSEGHPVNFDLGRRKAFYRYVTDSRGWQHCYTTIRDTKGRFWYWSYRPAGRGARTGNIKEYRIVRPYHANRLKTAIKRTLNRVK